MASEAEAQAAAPRSAIRPPNNRLVAYPFAVKDNIDVAGYESETAALPRLCLLPQRKMPFVVAKLRRGGAIFIARPTLINFATGLGAYAPPTARRGNS